MPNTIIAVVKNCIADELSKLTPRVTNCHTPNIKSKALIPNIALDRFINIFMFFRKFLFAKNLLEILEFFPQ